jgi:ferredoxin-NADP reductase
MDATPALAMRRHVVEEVKWETENVFTLVLKPEAAADRAAYLPGQWSYLHLLGSDGASTNRIALSIASAPELSSETLEFCVKIYGDSTKLASKLIPGDVVALQGPFGTFTLPEGESALVMFAAGIGITPLRCMIRSLAARKAPVDVVLFYSNKTVERTVYFEEFRDLAKEWPGLKLVFTLTENAPNKWEYETGRLNEAMFARHVSDVSRGLFLMCGPKPFMESVKALLEARGIDTKTRLKKESFG